jgi:hypothetical protein
VRRKGSKGSASFLKKRSKKLSSVRMLLPEELVTREGEELWQEALF